MAPPLSPTSSGLKNGLFQPILTMAQKSPKLTAQAGRTRAGANPVPFQYQLLRGPMQLGSCRFPGIVAPRGRHVGSGCRIGKISHVGWLSRVGFRGDPIKPSLDSRACISPLVPCIEVWLAVTLAACCSPRGRFRDGAENSKKIKIWQRGTHRKLHNSR